MQLHPQSIWQWPAFVPDFLLTAQPPRAELEVPWSWAPGRPCTPSWVRAQALSGPWVELGVLGWYPSHLPWFAWVLPGNGLPRWCQWGKELIGQCRRPKRRVWFLGWEDTLEEGMATHSSNHPWRIPWTEELSGLQSTWLQRVGRAWSDLRHTHAGRQATVNKKAVYRLHCEPDSYLI